MAARLFIGRVPMRSAGLVACLRRPNWIGVIARRALSSEPQSSSDKVTHTGQFWEDDDYRNLRFTDRTKQVNEQFAIDLVAEEPVVVVKDNHTWCDGGRGALGHPKIYINLDKPEIMDCGYCGKRFLGEKHKDLFKNESTVYE